jgi:hypothetical protein
MIKIVSFGVRLLFVVVLRVVGRRCENVYSFVYDVSVKVSKYISTPLADVVWTFAPPRGGVEMYFHRGENVLVRVRY